MKVFMPLLRHEYDIRHKNSNKGYVIHRYIGVVSVVESVSMVKMCTNYGNISWPIAHLYREMILN